MKIYNYHSSTGEFLSSANARENPLEPGQFLIPANATTTEPPESVEADHVAVWNGAAWVALEDNRGEVYDADGEAQTYSDLGPLPEGWSTEAPEVDPVTELANARAQMACSMPQMRIALHRIGEAAGADLLGAVSATASADPEASVVWEYATVIYRNSGFISALAATFTDPRTGETITDAAIDEIFTAAMSVAL